MRLGRREIKAVAWGYAIVVPLGVLDIWTGPHVMAIPLLLLLGAVITLIALWRTAPKGVELLCMRLADMHRVHPEQVVDVCHLCGELVGVYPSGQQVMREHPDAMLVCQVCREPGRGAKLAPGAEREPFESRRRLYPDD